MVLLPPHFAFLSPAARGRITRRARTAHGPHRAPRPRLLLCLATTLAALTLAGCDESAPPEDPRWGSLISERTYGVISKRDRITIVFTQDVAGEYLIGRPTTGVLVLEPAVEGAATFVSTRELVFAPAADLPSGQEYRVTLVREGLLGLPDDLGDYQFDFSVMQQRLELLVDGLDAESGEEDALVLTGSIVTADFAESEAVEGVLGAEQDGADLQIRWQHGPEGLNHRFAVQGVTRGGRDDEVRLRWDGRGIGTSSRETRDIPIPAQDVFRMISVRAESDDRQYALVRFSDPLDPNQNLNGLVSLGEESITLEVQGNALRIIPGDRVIGPVTVVLEEGLRSADGKRLEERHETEVTFVDVKPGVRFAGRGVVLPRADRLTVPIEAANVHSVQVTAFRVYETNIGQFLQANDLSEGRELRRTGRTLWRRTVELPEEPGGGWTRYTLDVSDVVRASSGSLVRLTLSLNRGNSTFACSEAQDRIPVLEEPWPADLEAAGSSPSSWDAIEASYQGSVDWRDRNDPCVDAYFRWSSRAGDSRNFLASNIGMTAKRDARGGTLVATTDLRTSEPMRGVAVTFMNYQNQPLETVVTGPGGLARTTLPSEPHHAVATRGGERGYLKMSPGMALPTSHFDVGGEVVAEGLKGAIYGERGVWRPGDDIHLTFVVDDADNPLPAGHPATLRLLNPLGQVVHTVTNADPVGDFYAFALRTAADAPTGNWNAAVEVGGARFSTPLKIETVMPNRLKVELDLGEGEFLQGGVRHEATLVGQWLSGAVARQLNTDVQVRFRSVPTAFTRFSDFVFDDPARDYSDEPLTVFEGTLDDEGHAAFTTELAPGGHSPGMLSATFTTRIFEPGGAFSTNRRSLRFSPYDRYVGVRLPLGDTRRGMLLTDTVHTVRVATLSPDGEPVSADSVDLTLYKIDWRWWWDRSAESLARYSESEHSSVVARGRVATTDGRGSWNFRVSYPDWGRYLLRACDTEGGHCTGRTVYIDWPGWAGRPQEQSGAGASALTLLADTTSYQVGDVAEIQLPEANTGRALVTLETGTRILDQRWVEMGGGRGRFEVPITAEMSPNVYVGVSLIQPHSDRANDRPIRLYGVIPLEVEDPATVLRPQIAVPEEWRPDTTVTVRVSEVADRPMTYTLAVVDEGLLGLTNYETPDLHEHFFSKEALGVSTWDIFDEVAGAYSAELERLLALGGDDAVELQERERGRFPPVVRFLGPFTLRPGQIGTHSVDIPEYIGQVRVMVVAGHEGAYGSASQSVFVRQPLSLLATVPRVVGPGEEIAVPVSLFAMEDGIERATVTLDVGEEFQVVGSASETVTFDGAEEQLARLRIRAGDRPGVGVLRFAAVAGEHRARSEIALPIRMTNPATATQLRARIAPGEEWSAEVDPHGIPGTNSATLEVTPLPPLNLEARLGYLVRYPHGCLEQIVSAVFAQMYLPLLVNLDADDRARVEENVQAGIDRLRGFQVSSGGFSYWPGTYSTANARNAWVTNYAGHFMIEAERLGYYVDPEVISSWKAHQNRRARSWRSRGDTPAMDQAYRLYTLARAGDYEVGAMNRLRQTGGLATAARWHLAAAYGLAGVGPGVRLLRDDDRIAEYAAPGWSMGSPLRDRGIQLEALVTLDRETQATRVAEEISAALYSDDWHGTHSVAYALQAMARFYGLGERSGTFTFERRAGDDVTEAVSSSPVYSEHLAGIAEQGGRVEVRNTSDTPLFVSLVTRGSPAAGDEAAASSGLAVGVIYTDPDGGQVDVRELLQGTDLVARVTVRNESGQDLRDLALEYRAPSGWEIHNARMDEGEGPVDDRIDYQEVRDDRVLTYFSLGGGERLTLSMRFNAAYLGDYYLPTVSVEAMYDASVYARIKGMRVRVAEGGGDEG
ncbi:alpha-2-macroglobulin family protein [Candidatus Palauibacter sp.]|uniref:alpha-2-macroglobulin family protein n=1 Tax=Candidatus Palauibacter sp. TaxID=3101350 RepID=UPI003C6FD997